MKTKGGWKTLSSKSKYNNPWIEVFEDKVVMPNGKEGIYGYVKKLPGVFVIAEDTDGGIFFITEYRYVLKQEIIQLPSGTLESHKDDPIIRAKHELEEETGITAEKFEKIGDYFVAPGHETTVSNTVVATGVDTSNIHTDDQEGNESIVSVQKYSREEIKKMIRSGEIRSGLTLAALNQYFNYKE
ncbi:hypothetical protein GF389_00450 [Candidatus Dojkabacteria bacterium]|nr:hypothetical protein [Candidatus Dojkabacteria bacterium]